MQYMMLPVAGVLLIMLSSVVSPATIKGDVYDYNLKPIDDVIITVDSEPMQKVISKDGQYKFELEPGRYHIKAEFYEHHILLYEIEEETTIKKDGTYNLDLILLPSFQEEDMLLEEFDEILPNEKEESSLSSYLIALGVILFLIVFVYIYRRRKKRKAEEKNKGSKKKESKNDKKRIKEKNQAEKGLQTKQETKQQKREDEKGLQEKEPIRQDKEQEKNKEIEPQVKQATRQEIKQAKEEASDPKRAKEEVSNPKPAKEDASEPKPIKAAADDDPKAVVLNLIMKEKRTTQKEIRKQVPLSEAKISLIISELESEQKIRKIKKGRGNILIAI